VVAAGAVAAIVGVQVVVVLPQVEVQEEREITKQVQQFKKAQIQVMLLIKFQKASQSILICHLNSNLLQI